MAEEITPIPSPPGLPLLGNIADIDKNESLKSFQSLQAEYGDIFKLSIGNFKLVVLSTHELVNEVCDETRFKKIPDNVLTQVRNGVSDGLFTAYLEEPNWGIAHRVLMPAFGPLSIRNMFDEMHDVASQLVLKWARRGQQHRILLTDDFTRLTLDTIALSSMGFRFNSYYDEKMHPFITAMGEFLTESGRRSQRLPMPAMFYRTANQRYQYNIDIMRDTAQAVIDERNADPGNERKDLLAAMLKGRDALTGDKMSDQSIIDNLITFLIAGHETTSGTLSYAMHQLLKNPEEYRKVQREVDEVVGKGPITVQHMQKLPYINAVIRETLRLDSPIPVFSVSPVENTIIGGMYEVNKGESMLNLLSRMHLDPKVYDEPLKFKPERMLDENFNKLPKNSWKPFGNGVRACIGRAFAWQEMVLAMAMIFQNFELSLDDPDYSLEHNQTLTIKPKNLYIRAKMREGLDATKLEDRISRTGGGQKATAATPAHKQPKSKDIQDEGPMKITILYGSNSGTCESMAESLASDAPSHGYKVVNFAPMDEATENLPRDDPKHPVVVITASYEGQPPDNATKFVKWIENPGQNVAALSGTSYAVFGCGNHDWVQTFHRIPRLVDRRLGELGGKRVVDIGLADAAGDDMFMSFETWGDEVLWPALDAIRAESEGPSAALRSLSSQILKVHPSANSTTPSRRGVTETKVIGARTLTAEGEPVKKHIEIQLPQKSTYKAGDYLAILPSNPKASILRALRRFNIPWDGVVSLEGSSITLPTNVSMYARTILSDFVELGQPITKKGILQLADATNAENDAAALKSLAKDDAYSAEISAKRVSILDLLERYPSVKLDIGVFLALLPPMRVRQYSISSSPRANPSSATISYSLLAEKAKSGHGTYNGVASSYLSSLQAEDPIHISVRPSNAHFHLPEMPENDPIILIAAGTGIAPFRGFIQERAQLVGKQKLAPAVLYYGCREAGRDDLYADELEHWEGLGAVSIRRAYSRAPYAEHKYVQDALWANREELNDLWEKNAKVYVCGSRALSLAVDKVALKIFKEASERKGEEADETKIKEWWEGLRNVRYVADVFD